MTKPNPPGPSQAPHQTAGNAWSKPLQWTRKRTAQDWENDTNSRRRLQDQIKALRDAQARLRVSESETQDQEDHIDSTVVDDVTPFETDDVGPYHRPLENRFQTLSGFETRLIPSEPKTWDRADDFGSHQQPRNPFEARSEAHTRYIASELASEIRNQDQEGDTHSFAQSRDSFEAFLKTRPPFSAFEGKIQGQEDDARLHRQRQDLFDRICERQIRQMEADKSKVVLITAGTAGLGAQIARAFAPDSRLVISYAHNDDRARALVEELEGIQANHLTTAPTLPGPRIFCVKSDAGDKDSVQRLVEHTVSIFHRLDVVISNVGWTRITNFMDLDDGARDEDWDRCFTYNVKTHLWLMHAARQHLEKTEGAFVCTASVAGMKPAGSSLPYSVTKAALIHLAKGLASICSPKIRVNTVSPGLLETDWGMQFPEAKREAVKNNSKLKRLPTVQDVADQVRLLALNQSITGQNVCIDAGMMV